jgi:hypothetical protein
MKILLIILVLYTIISINIVRKNKSNKSIFKKSGNKFKNGFLITSIMIMLCVYIYFKLVWVQIMDVRPEDERIDYTNKMLWINMDYIDVTSDEHKKWSNNMLINQAPNKLGSYIDVLPKTFTKVDMLRHIETFNMMFKHPLKYVYFNNKPNVDVLRYCNEKGVKVIRNPFRRTIK